jgi:hypothetical protein
VNGGDNRGRRITLFGGRLSNAFPPMSPFEQKIVRENDEMAPIFVKKKRKKCVTTFPHYRLLIPVKIFT